MALLRKIFTRKRAQKQSPGGKLSVELYSYSHVHWVGLGPTTVLLDLLHCKRLCSFCGPPARLSLFFVRVNAQLQFPSLLFLVPRNKRRCTTGTDRRASHVGGHRQRGRSHLKPSVRIDTSGRAHLQPGHGPLRGRNFCSELILVPRGAVWERPGGSEDKGGICWGEQKGTNVLQSVS